MGGGASVVENNGVEGTATTEQILNTGQYVYLLFFFEIRIYFL